MVPEVSSFLRKDSTQHMGLQGGQERTHESPTALLHAHPSPHALSHTSMVETALALLVYGEGWQSPASKYTCAGGNLSPSHTTHATAASRVRRFGI